MAGTEVSSPDSGGRESLSEKQAGADMADLYASLGELVEVSRCLDGIQMVVM